MKGQRLAIIQEIISTQQVGSQEELLQLLSAKGYSITQATLSRDIRKLQIVKRPNQNGDYVYTLDHERVSPHKGTQKTIDSIEFSGHLAVVKTRPGYAAAIASEIDSVAPKEIAGTIAGDDTILIIPREGISREEIKKVLKPML